MYTITYAHCTTYKRKKGKELKKIHPPPTIDIQSRHSNAVPSALKLMPAQLSQPQAPSTQGL